MKLACVVEGHGEVEALPVILRRIASAVNPEKNIVVLPPIRVGRQRIFQPHEFERTIKLATAKAGIDGAVLFLLDADDDCPSEKCWWIKDEARRIIPDITISAVMAKREFEAWFIAAAESLAGYRGLSVDLLPPAYPEAIRGAKEWLSGQMGNRKKYRATMDQAAFSAKFDMELALSRSSSFSKLYRDVRRLLVV